MITATWFLICGMVMWHRSMLFGLILFIVGAMAISQYVPDPVVKSPVTINRE